MSGFKPNFNEAHPFSIIHFMGVVPIINELISESSLTDAMAKMIGNQPFHALTYAGQRYDCGSRLGFLEANVAVALNRPDTSSDTRALLGRLLKG